MLLARFRILVCELIDLEPHSRRIMSVMMPLCCYDARHDALHEAEHYDGRAALVNKADREREPGHGQHERRQYLDVEAEEEDREERIDDVDRPVREPELERAPHRHRNARRDQGAAQRLRSPRHPQRQPARHDGRFSPSPSFTASRAALVRSFTRSFRKMLATWFLTVCSLMKSRFPISRFDSPVARSRRISSSRAVSVSSCSR